MIAGYFLFFNRPKDVGYYKVEEKDLINTITTQGNIIGEETVSLSFGISGAITEINVKEGETIRKDSILAKIDDSINASQYSRRIAEYERARINYERLIENTIPLQKIEFDNAEKNYIQAQNSLENYNRLYEEGAISKEELEFEENEFDRIELNYNNAKGRLESLEKDREDALKNLEISEKLMDEARIGTEDTTILSPFNGKVLDVNGHVGKFASVGETIITLKTESDKTFIEAELDEDLFGRVYIGQEVLISPRPRDRDDVYEGKINEIRPLVDDSKGTFKIVIASYEKIPEVLTGMGMNIQILIDRIDSSLFLEPIFLIEDNEDYYALRIQNNRTVKQQLQGQKLDSGYFIIEKGLTKGDKVVLPGETEDGERVNPVP